MQNTPEQLGVRLARIRSSLDWTQEDLAKRAGVKQSTVASIENGSRATRPGSLIEIAHALGVDAYYLKYGVRVIVAGDKTIDQVVELLKETSREGKAVVLDKAKDIAVQYPINSISSKQRKSS